MTLLLIYVLGALSISFLCSVLEAALLSIRGYQLAARVEAGDAAAAVLLDIKEHRLDDAISAILTLNTIAHTIGAGMAGAQAERVFGEAWVGLFVLILTLLVLLFTEIIPKTLGTLNAHRLVGFVGRTLTVLMKLLRPALFLTKLLTGLISHGAKAPVSKNDLRALVSMAQQAGTIQARETRLLFNILGIGSALVEDVMTPRTVVKMLPDDGRISDLLGDPTAAAYSRLPLRLDSKDEVTGYVLKQDVLQAIADGASRDEPLARFRRVIRYIPEHATISHALEQFLEGGEHFTLVVDEYGGVSGILTLEDVLETLIGAEIVDEFDEIPDLRHRAAEVRDRRLSKARMELGAAPGSAESKPLGE